MAKRAPKKTELQVMGEFVKRARAIEIYSPIRWVYDLWNLGPGPLEYAISEAERSYAERRARLNRLMLEHEMSR